MTIREYFDNMITDNMAEEDWDEIWETEETIYHCYEDDYDDFCMWAIENGIDPTARDPHTGEYVTVEWAWDMCGD